MVPPLTLLHSGSQSREKGKAGALWLSLVAFPFYSTRALALGWIFPHQGTFSRNDLTYTPEICCNFLDDSRSSEVDCEGHLNL